MRAALLQLTSSDDPGQNLAVAAEAIAEAAGEGADLVLTPEVTNCVSASRTHQEAVLAPEGDDPTLAGLREAAARHGVWLLVGSLALKTSGPRFANRSFLVAPDGAVTARYDKIHMFDVDVDAEESYRESAAFSPGDRMVTVAALGTVIGMTVCYDIRFPHLYRALAQAGAEILTVPAAFSPVTGAAHWETLLRARAIETGCWVLAPAQTGRHAASRGRARRTYGHSMAVAPWGEVVADAGAEPGVTLVEIDMTQVAEARRRVPSLSHDRPFHATEHHMPLAREA
jgi:predicted amidohydrolase